MKSKTLLAKAVGLGAFPGKISTMTTYFVQASTDRSSVSIGTDHPAEALAKAREMVSPKHAVTIRDQDGALYSEEELEQIIRKQRGEVSSIVTAD